MVLLAAVAWPMTFLSERLLLGVSGRTTKGKQCFLLQTVFFFSFSLVMLKIWVEWRITADWKLFWNAFKKCWASKTKHRQPQLKDSHMCCHGPSSSPRHPWISSLLGDQALQRKRWNEERQKQHKQWRRILIHHTCRSQPAFFSTVLFWVFSWNSVAFIDPADSSVPSPFTHPHSAKSSPAF